MKITQEHYALLVTMLDNLNAKVKICEQRLTAECNDLNHVPDANTSQGLPPMRFRWDMLFAVPYDVRTEWLDIIYQYANDDHIDIALKKYFNNND